MYANYKKFKKLLSEKGITAYRVHIDTGIPQATLSDWKLGKSKPKIEKISILADYFNVPIEYFLED